MVKPRFCPSRVQSSPVKASLGFWPSPLQSTSCFSPRTLDCGNVVVKGIFGHIGRSLGCDVDTTGAKPAHARHVLGWTSVSSPLYPAVTRRTVGCRAVTRRTVGCGRLKVPSSRLCGREIGYYRYRGGTRSHQGPGSDIKVVDIKVIRFPLLEARLWQEAKSNLVRVALGKDDWIAWPGPILNYFNVVRDVLGDELVEVVE
ncbi:hypothetical protein YC2023_050918 [Brassica napus]